MGGGGVRIKVSKRVRDRLKGEIARGGYAGGYRPGWIDETYKQVVGHYPTSRKTTIKDKDGNYRTGKRV